MKIMNTRFFTAIALTLAPSQKGCMAFTAHSSQHFKSPSSSFNVARRVSAFSKTNAIQSRNFPLNMVNSSSHSNPIKSSSVTTSVPSPESTESELERALEHARAMDKMHGLCTEPSQEAWSAVDVIYHKMQAMQSFPSPERNASTIKVRVAKPSKKSSNGSRGLRMSSGLIATKGVAKTTGRKYYF